MIADWHPGHIDQIKQINAGAVYQLIDRYGPISRIELSKRAHLAPASITKIVRELFDAHLVKETEYQEIGSRGRPAIGVILDTEAWHYLSVRINHGCLTLALHDLSARIVVEEQISLPTERSTPLLSILVDEINQFFTRNQRKLERLTAIAVTLPGIINSSQGIVHRMPFYDVKDMPLAAELHKKTGVSIFVQQDVCAWTMAESLYGAAKDLRNVIQVVIDHNVGAGVIADGRLLHAGTRSLVEIGHTQVDPYGKRCYCGNHGCLETVAGISNVLELVHKRLPAAPESILHHQPISVESLCNAALQSDPLAKDIIIGVGHNVGRILAIMVNLFNPEKILIGSPLNQAATLLHPVIESCILQQSLPSYSKEISVEPTYFMNKGTMPGAALIREALYDGSLLIKLLQG